MKRLLMASLQVVLAAGVAVSGAATARAACAGPATLTAALHAHATVENAVALGNWFAGHKQFDCAVDTFRAALKTSPNSAELHYLTGLALVGGGHTASAIPELEASERLQPDAPRPHLLLAHLYDAANQTDKASPEWRQALKIDPHSQMALEGLSADLLAEQDYAGVVALLHDAPRTEKLTISLAKALGVLNHLDAARAVLDEGLKLAPNSVPLASAETVVLVKQTHYQDAVNLLNHTVAANPTSWEARLELFRLLVLTNRMSQARPMGPKMLAERPHDPEVLYLNGVIERTLGDNQQARAHLEEAVQLDPNFFNSRYNLGKVLVILQQWQEAKEQLQKAIALGAIEPQVHYELGMALRGLGETQAAAAEIKLYQDGRKSEESSLEASMDAAQGDKDLEGGDVKEALAHYTQAVEDQPANALYKYKLALAFDRSGDTAAERAALEDSIKLDPQMAGAQRELGYLLARAGDTAGSIEHFKLAVKAQPSWTEAWVNLSAELAEAGQFADARQAAAMALRLDPQNAQAKELSSQLARDPNAQ